MISAFLFPGLSNQFKDGEIHEFHNMSVQCVRRGAWPELLLPKCGTLVQGSVL